MADLTKSTVNAEFKKTCAGADVGAFTFELDSVRNNGKSSFTPITDTAYLKLFPGGLGPRFWQNLGSAYITGSGMDTVTEDITFVDSDSSNLQGIPAGLVSWNWIGATRGYASVTFTGGTIKLSSKVTGVLHTSYQAAYDVVAVTCNVLGSVLLTAEKGDRKGNTTVDFNAVITTKEVYIVVKYACTNEVQPDANVYVDGNFIGITDKEGKIYAGKLATGRHTCKVTKVGFIDSNNDTIANDYFDIP